VAKTACSVVVFDCRRSMRLYDHRGSEGVVPEIVEIQSGGPQAPFGITGVDSRKEVAATDVSVPREDQEAPDAGGGRACQAKVGTSHFQKCSV